MIDMEVSNAKLISIVRGSWQSRVKIIWALKFSRPGFKASLTTWQAQGFREIT